MFKRYEYTCPDVIHYNKVRQRTNLITYIVLKLLLMVGITAAIKSSARKNAAKDNEPVPTV